MLLQLLSVFGLDVEARLADVRSRLELRFEQATGELQRAALDVAQTAIMAAAAGVAAAAAIGVGLVALYRWVAEFEGAYVALGVVAAVLVVLSIILAIAAGMRTRSIRRRRRPPVSSPGVERSIRANTQSDAKSDAKSDDNAGGARLPSPVPAAASARPAPGAAVWSELAAFVLPLLMRMPAGDGAALAARLRERGSGSLHSALHASANFVREGERGNLVLAVAGAMLAGWLMSHRMHEQNRSN
jgi:hypothetical protein